ncbi:MAG: efflux RND transporter permease subunit [Bacteroidaceae bacterium]|nr:efflux RND transporter permease subunit [Bacteroidaceae bacterium]
MNIGKWAFSNKLLVYFMVGVLVVGGMLSIYEMPKLEDPEVKVKIAMVVTTYPGASAHQVEMEVTDVLEKEIRTMGDIDNIESSSFNDLSIIQVELRSTIANDEVEQCWDRLRRKVYDAQAKLPAGAGTSVTKEDFSAVYGMFYALTADGLSERELIKYSDLLKNELGSIEAVERVEVYGAQHDCIEIRLLQDKLSALGVMPAEVLSTLSGQNKTSYAGYYDNGDQRVRVTVTDKFQKVADIRRMLIQGHEKDQLRISDIAEVERSIEKPVRNAMTYDGNRALGILLSASSKADITKVGVEVEERLEELRKTRFPTGVEVHKVFYQPDRVKESLSTFVINLIESVIIVVVILMFFMGIKSGVIIGTSLCVIVVGSFLLLGALDGTMQRVSLAAFILAMGMLVDNAIVIIDGILVDLKAHKPRMEALTEIGRRTAMPLLGATIIAILSFFPIFLSPDTAGIYVRDLFIILAVSLLLSWILALVHVPLMADRMFTEASKKAQPVTDPYGGKVYRLQRRVMEFCLKHRKTMAFSMVVMVILAGIGYPFMHQGFFPDMVYDQCYLEYKLPEGANSTQVEKDLEKMQAYLREHYPVKHITASIGGTPGRYNLVRTIATPSLAYGELIIDFESPEALVENLEEIQTYLNREFPQAYAKIKLYNLMFKKYPIEVQFSGPDPAVLHALADTAQAFMEETGKVRLITTNWEPKVPLISVDYDQEAARAIGLSRSDLSLSLMTAGGGIPVGDFYDGIYSNNIYVKITDEQGENIDNLQNMQVFPIMPSLMGLLTEENLMRLRTGKLDKAQLLSGIMGTTPLRQVSRSVDVCWEDPIIPRYNGVRQQRVQCSPIEGLETERARKAVAGKIDKMTLPPGYRCEWMGEKQASDRSMKYLFANFPLAVILMIAILIMLFGDAKKPAIIFLTIPLVFVGVVGTMLVSQMTFTFCAIVGALGLIGMVVKNGIVLMDEIDLQLSEGKAPKEALIRSSQSRLRPVMMASMTTILGMIPLLTDAMFGSMAATIMGGLLFGTFITLIFVPVLYAMFFGVKTK